MLKKILEKIYLVEELFVGYALLIVAIAATVQVFMRYVLNLSLDWVEEGSRYTVVMITFIGASICVRYGTHFTMDALIQYSSNRVKHFLKIISNLVSSAVMIVVFYFSWGQIEKLYQYEVTTPSIEMPMYIPYLPIGIFTILISFRFFMEAVKHIIGLKNNTPFHINKGSH